MDDENKKEGVECRDGGVVIFSQLPETDRNNRLSFFVERESKITKSREGVYSYPSTLVGIHEGNNSFSRMVPTLWGLLTLSRSYEMGGGYYCG